MKLRITKYEPKKHQEFVKSTVGYMTTEFEKYITGEQEVPWYYNERATLGFYINGLVRNNKDAVVLQEFSCGKGKDNKQKGRSDLWIRYAGKSYIVEAKQHFSSINTNSDFGDAEAWAKSALKQAADYFHDDTAVILSLCFEVVYCSETELGAYPDLIKSWREEEKHNLDFYTVIYVDDVDIKNNKGFLKSDSWFYPAVAVYGIFNK